MLPRERVIEVLKRGKPDRIPVYSWVRINLEKQITEKWGSVENFEDKYEFDLSHIFGRVYPYSPDLLKEIRAKNNGVIEPEILLDYPQNDPNDMSQYKEIIEGIQYYKNTKGRFVYIQTPGIFECLNGPFGIENHLSYLLLYEDSLQEVYRRQAQWNRNFAMNCIDLGIDMVHVSDDWGMQNNLMFSPEIWWKLIYPNHKITCDAVKKRGTYVSLHCDGNCNDVLDGVIKLGYDVLHPYQESAGMNYPVYKQKYAGSFIIMGGLCVQTTIGFNKRDFLEKEIRRILDMFAKDKHFIYCTTHFIQNHCSMEELEFAYNMIHDYVRR